jgi:hypothetical protein
VRSWSLVSLSGGPSPRRVGNGKGAARPKSAVGGVRPCPLLRAVWASGTSPSTWPCGLFATCPLCTHKQRGGRWILLCYLLLLYILNKKPPSLQDENDLRACWSRISVWCVLPTPHDFRKSSTTLGSSSDSHTIARDLKGLVPAPNDKRSRLLLLLLLLRGATGAGATHIIARPRAVVGSRVWSRSPFRFSLLQFHHGWMLCTWGKYFPRL